MSRGAPGRVASRPAFEALQARLLLSSDPLLSGTSSTLCPYQISPTWFENVEVHSSETWESSALQNQQGVSKLDWKGQTLDVRTDQWIVQFTSAAVQGVGSVAQTASLLGSGVGFQVLRGLGMVGSVLLQTSGADFDSVQQWFGLNDNIAYFEPNAILTTQVIPNDSDFSNLWGLNNTGQSFGTPDADIDAVEAWEISTGSSDVVVGVIDTGVDYTHVDLAANMWTNPGEIPGDGIDNDGNGHVDDVYGWDFVNNDDDPMDDHNHGTHVAGTIGAVGDNATGVAGVNWNVRIMALKFLSASGSGSIADAVKAVNYATMMKRDYGVNIVATNNSWGGGGYSTSMYNAIAAGGDEGILFVAAAGNGGYDGIGDDNDATPHYPSNYDLDAVIAVAATDRNDNRASFSNYGINSVDLAAPGVSVYSTLPGNTYGSFNGTSMATPHVAGVVALLSSLGGGATAAEIRSAILSSADPIPAMGGLCVTGGRLNAYEALQALGIVGPRVLSISPTPTSMPVSTITIRFTDDILPASVAPSNFLLRDNGADDAFDTADDTVFSFEVSDFSQPQTDRVQISLSATLVFEQYRLTLLGTGANPIRNSAGQVLNDGVDEVYLFEIAPAQGPNEPNDALSEATNTGVVGYGTVVVTGHVGDGFYSGKDVDIFVFEALGGMTITADIDAYQIGTGLDPVLRLFDAAGNELAMNDDADGFDSLIVYGAGGGTYYIGVSGYGNMNYNPTVDGSGTSGSTGDYQLTLIIGAGQSTGLILGAVWNDGNGDGVQDGGETSLESWTVFADLNNNGAYEQQTQSTTNSTDVPQSILDYTTLLSDLTVVGISGSIADVNVTLNISHTYDADLEVYLNSPDGTRVELFTRVGGGGENFANTTLDDEASTSIVSGLAPFWGSYMPEGALSDFNGEDPNGVWTLEITDVAGMDTGTLNSWSLSITTGEPAAQTDASGQYQLNNLDPGSHRIMVLLQSDWVYTSPSTGYQEVTVSGGQVVEDIDFGVRQALPAAVEVVVNQAALQRSTIKMLSIRFGEDVSGLLNGNDLSAFNDSLGANVDVSAATFSYDGLSFTASWDLSPVSFVNAYYTVTLGPSMTFSHQLHRLLADANGDAAVSVGDLGIVSGNYGSSGVGIPGDLNDDGTVNIGDLAIVATNSGNKLTAVQSMGTRASRAVESTKTATPRKADHLMNAGRYAGEEASSVDVLTRSGGEELSATAGEAAPDNPASVPGGEQAEILSTLTPTSILQGTTRRGSESTTGIGVDSGTQAPQGNTTFSDPLAVDLLTLPQIEPALSL